MVTLFIQVKPSSFKDEITFDEKGQLLVKIKERPIDGAANDYLIRFLSKELNIRKSDILLEKGTTSRFKKICLSIEQSTFDQLISRYKK